MNKCSVAKLAVTCMCLCVCLCVCFLCFVLQSAYSVCVVLHSIVSQSVVIVCAVKLETKWWWLCALSELKATISELCHFKGKLCDDGQMQTDGFFSSQRPIVTFAPCSGTFPAVLGSKSSISMPVSVCSQLQVLFFPNLSRNVISSAYSCLPSSKTSE